MPPGGLPSGRAPVRLGYSVRTRRTEGAALRHVAICIDADEVARPGLAGARRFKGAHVSALHLRRAGEDDGGRDFAIAELIASELPDADAQVLEQPDLVAAMLEWAEDHEPDLIVVGARESPETSAPLSVVAQSILDGARCSVLVARVDATPRLADYVHVGACVDLSDDSLAVLEEARPLVSEKRILDLVHVVTGPTSGRRKTADGLVRALASAVHAEPVMLEGDPATELLAWQGRVGADLLVAAAGSPRAPARGIGPVSASLAARASCDVLVARCPRPSGCTEVIPPAGMIAANG